MKTEDVRAFWDEKAAENPTYYISSYRPYDEQDPAEFWRWGEILTDRYLNESGIAFTGRERILDLGCGIGRMTRALAARFRSVHGVDVSQMMIERARRELRDIPNVSFSIGDGATLEQLHDASFDLAFSYLTLQHIPSTSTVRNYIAEIHRVLAPGGYVHVQFDASPRRIVERLPRVILTAVAWLRRRDQPGPSGCTSPAWTGSRVSEAQARAMTTDAGLRVLRVRGAATKDMWVTAEKRRA